MKTGASPERLALAKRVAALRRAAWYFPEIANELGISTSYASSLWYDPDGAKDRARKKRYAGKCEKCGGPTTGSLGRARAPKVCAKCASVKVWTHERVLDAIRRYAAANGRPPTATDWQRADRGNGYPAASSVYSADESCPFASWADAIEAAGFERPRVGKRDGDYHWDSPEAVLAAIAAASVDGVAPSADGAYNVASAARRFFGSWNAACTAAGVTARNGEVRRPGTWTEDLIVREIRALAIGDYPPTAGEDITLRGAAVSHFGSWAAAVRAAGFEPYVTHAGNAPRSRKRRELVSRREARRSARRSRAASDSSASA